MAIKAKKLQAAKTQAIADIKAKFESANDYIFAEYRGLTVEQITNLRGQLRAKGCSFKVIKNNFARIAFEEMKKADVSSYLTGPTAVALSSEEANTVAPLRLLEGDPGPRYQGSPHRRRDLRREEDRGVLQAPRKEGAYFHAYVRHAGDHFQVGPHAASRRGQEGRSVTKTFTRLRAESKRGFDSNGCRPGKGKNTHRRRLAPNGATIPAESNTL